MHEDEKARHMHNAAIDCRICPIGGNWEGGCRYRIGDRIYDFSAIDPNNIAYALAFNLVPYTEA